MYQNVMNSLFILNIKLNVNLKLIPNPHITLRCYLNCKTHLIFGQHSNGATGSYKSYEEQTSSESCILWFTKDEYSLNELIEYMNR